MTRGTTLPTLTHNKIIRGIIGKQHTRVKTHERWWTSSTLCSTTLETSRNTHTLNLEVQTRPNDSSETWKRWRTDQTHWTGPIGLPVDTPQYAMDLKKPCRDTRRVSGNLNPEIHRATRSNFLPLTAVRDETSTQNLYKTKHSIKGKAMSWMQLIIYLMVDCHCLTLRSVSSAY